MKRRQNKSEPLFADLSNLRLEGATIIRVIEEVDVQRLTIDVSYPIPEGGSTFPQRRLFFRLCGPYLINEKSAYGLPAIQRVEIVEKLERESHRIKVILHTDRGIREVNCLSHVMEESI